MSRIQLYRPSNGTEGDSFQARWCDRCRRDTPNRPCGILGNAFFLNIEDAGYPLAWRYVDGVPTCTEFVDASIPVVRSHKPGRTQLPLFDDTDWLPVLVAADVIDETDPKRAEKIRELVKLRNPKAVELAKAVKPKFFPQ